MRFELYGRNAGKHFFDLFHNVILRFFLLFPSPSSPLLRFMHAPWPSSHSKINFFSVTRRRMPLGVEDRRIPDSAFRASSEWDRNHRASNARLNRIRKGHRTGAWSSRYNKRGQWIEVDIGSPARVTGIALQGRQDANQWVTRYVVAFSKYARRRFRFYKIGRRLIVSK